MIIQLHRGQSIIGKLIQWQTRGQYSHASVAIANGYRFESKEFKGVLFNREHPTEEIHFYRINLSLEEQEKCLEFIKRVNGLEYDYKMVMRFMSRRGVSYKSKDKYFCSELIFDMLASAGVFLFNNTQGWEVSPQLLSRSTKLERIRYDEIDFVKDYWHTDIIKQLYDTARAIN